MSITTVNFVFQYCIVGFLDPNLHFFISDWRMRSYERIVFAPNKILILINSVCDDFSENCDYYSRLSWLLLLGYIFLASWCNHSNWSLKIDFWKIWRLFWFHYQVPKNSNWSYSIFEQPFLRTTWILILFIWIPMNLFRSTIVK